MFKANTISKCSECGLEIAIGEAVSWNRKTGAKYHVSCKQTKSVPANAVLPKHKEETTTMQTQTVNTSENLKNALIELIGDSVTSKAPALNIETVRDLVIKEVEAATKNNTRIITIVNDPLPNITVKLAHEKLETLIKFCSMRQSNGNRINIYLHGNAGSGKSKAAEQVSEILGLQFGTISLNPQTPESRLIGYMNAVGNYVETEFFKRYTQGGIYCIDEVDNASGGLLCTLNSLLENGLGAFPHGIFPRHKDFICICTANTIGRGGNINYPERRALDSSFLDRFEFILWDYDFKLVRSIVESIIGNEAESFINMVDNEKEKLQSKNPSHVVSPRAYIQGATMKHYGFCDSDIISAVIARGVK